MSNHPNRNWARRWQINVAARTATHENGLVVRFTPSADGGYDGEVLAGMPALSRDAAVAQSQAQRLTRLLREAGEAYAKAAGRDA